MDLVLTHSQLVRWRTAIFAIFLASGLSISTWAARVPAIRQTLDATLGDIGLMLLMAGIASIVGLSTSSVVLVRWGPRRSMLVMILTFSAGLVLIGVGTDLARSWEVVTAGLILWGFGNGCLDVIMNVDGTAIEKQMKRTILPLFHAFFSFGTVIGAGLGVLAINLGMNVLWHIVALVTISVVIAIVALATVPAREHGEASAHVPFRHRLRQALSAWGEPRTYALGAIMLGMAFAEGGANDWLALGVVDGHGADQALGAAALATFSVCMPAVRTLGSPLVDRLGRVLTLRILAVLAASGLLLFILAPTLPLVFVGAGLWGMGASLGFPIGMSAAADEPAKAAARVAATATIGYVAFLAGPPILGYISSHIGLLNTLYIIVALIVLSGFASGAARPTPGSAVGAGHAASTPAAGG